MDNLKFQDSSHDKSKSDSMCFMRLTLDTDPFAQPSHQLLWRFPLAVALC